MSQNTNTAIARRFGNKRLLATVLAATFLLGFVITVSVSYAGFNPTTDGAETLVETAAAVIRTLAGECDNSPLGPDAICKEICLTSGQGQTIPTGTFMCALPGQTTP